MSEETSASAGAIENADNEQQMTGEFTREQIEKADPETSETSEPEAKFDAETSARTAAEAAPEEPEEISYHAVEKEGKVAAIWEMQGRKHLRTIDPRSSEGKHILSLFTSEHHEEAA